jgi:hypothetical protein
VRLSTFSAVVIYIKRLSGTSSHTKHATNTVQSSAQNEKRCMNTAHQLCYHHHHHHHHHVHEGLGVFSVSWYSKWNWSLHLLLGRPMFLRPFVLYCNACFGIIFVSILCTCCMSVGPFRFFEDFTSIWCPLDMISARRRVSLLVGLPPWCF